MLHDNHTSNPIGVDVHDHHSLTTLNIPRGFSADWRQNGHTEQPVRSYTSSHRSILFICGFRRFLQNTGLSIEDQKVSISLSDLLGLSGVLLKALLIHGILVLSFQDGLQNV